MKTLHTVLGQAEAERDRALTAMRLAEDLAQQRQVQAQQLQAYRSEYQQRWSGQFSRRGTMEIVQCYQSFMQRLDEALAQQQQQAAAAQAQAQQARQRLLAAETRVASVRKLMERRQAEHRLLQERREQRQTDETAQQIHWHADRAEPAQH
jgi:flagellar FliJ protein